MVNKNRYSFTFSYYLVIIAESPAVSVVTRYLKYELWNRVKNAELRHHLTPDYQLGSKQICFSYDYLEMFGRENVSLITDCIDCFTESGIKTQDGTLHAVDTIILATGFDPTACFMSFKAYGSKGKNVSLQDEWGNAPNAYLTLTYPGYPNLFFLFGPGACLGHNSAFFQSECSASYVSDAIQKMVEHGIRSIDVKRHIKDMHWQWVQESMKTKVFGRPTCTSWYRNIKGVNYTLWPSNCVHYWWVTRKIDLNDYNCIY